MFLRNKNSFPLRSVINKSPFGSASIAQGILTPSATSTAFTLSGKLGSFLKSTAFTDIVGSVNKAAVSTAPLKECVYFFDFILSMLFSKINQIRFTLARAVKIC